MMPIYRSKVHSPLEASPNKYRTDALSPLEASPTKYRSRESSPLVLTLIDSTLAQYCDVATDGSYLYFVGFQYISPYYYAIIHKRDLVTLAIVDSLEYMYLTYQTNYLTCWLDGSKIYVGGLYYTTPFTVWQQIVQRRDKSNLSSLDWTFTEAVGPTSYINGIIVDGTQVYNVGYTNLVLKSALNKTTGAKVWQFNNTATAPSGISDDENYIFIHKHAGGLRALEKVDRVNGAVASDTAFTPESNVFRRGAYESSKSALYIGGVHTFIPSAQGCGFCSKISLGSPPTEVWRYDFPVAASVSDEPAARYYNGSIYVVGMTTVGGSYKPYIVKLADDGSTVEATWTGADTTVIGLRQLVFVGGDLFTYYLKPGGAGTVIVRLSSGSLT